MIHLQFKCNNQAIGIAVSAEGRENNVKLKQNGVSRDHDTPLEQLNTSSVKSTPVSQRDILHLQLLPHHCLWGNIWSPKGRGTTFGVIWCSLTRIWNQFLVLHGNQGFRCFFLTQKHTGEVTEAQMATCYFCYFILSFMFASSFSSDPPKMQLFHIRLINPSKIDSILPPKHVHTAALRGWQPKSLFLCAILWMHLFWSHGLYGFYYSIMYLQSSAKGHKSPRLLKIAAPYVI